MEDMTVLHAVAAGLAMGMISDGGVPMGMARHKDWKPMDMIRDGGVPLSMARQDWKQMDMIRDQEVPMIAAPRADATVDVKEHPTQTVSHNNPQTKKPYASTYQVAHCGAKARPPTACISEFPPQRPNPSPTQGNFQVGNGVHHSPSPTRNSENFRKIRHEEGRVTWPKPDRDVDAFVSSLRRYPSAERTPSNDLIERLLKTHTTFPKDSSLELCRTLGDKHVTKEVKNLQVLRRGKMEEGRRPALKKPGSQFNVRQRTQSEKYPVPSAVSVASFDYLNSGIPCPGTDSPNKKENRTLENVFRDLYQNERGPVMAFPICPMMQGRYERHLKKCHPTTSQASRPDASKMKTCSRCMKKRPCPCDAMKNVRLLVDKEEENKKALEDAIFSWLKDVPVYANEKPHDKFIRDAIVKKLAETLNDIKADELTVKGKEEIRKAIEKLPIWYPKDERDRDNFKNNIIDSLLDKIKTITDKKKVQQAAADFIDTLNFDSSKEIDKEQIVNDLTKELNKLSLNRPENDDIYRDMIKIKAFELLDHLPIKTRGNRYEYLNKLSDDFVDRIISVMKKPIEAEHRENLSQGISDILDTIGANIQNRAQVEKTLGDVAADLVSQDLDSDKAETYIRTALEGKVPKSKMDEITTKVLQLVDESKKKHEVHPETADLIKRRISNDINLTHVKPENHGKVKELIYKSVQHIVTKGLDENEGRSYIESVLGGKVPVHAIDNITEDVLTLAGQAKTHHEERTVEDIGTIDQETKEIIREDIIEILDSSDATIKDRGKVEGLLHKAVTDIVTKNINKSKATTIIRNILKGKVSDDKIQAIADQVLNMADQVKPTQATIIDPAMKEIIKEDISEILDSSNVHMKNRGRIADSLNKAIADIVRSDMDQHKAVEHIKSVLKGKVSDDKIETIAEQVVTLADRANPKSITIDREIKQIIKEDIHDILNESGVNIKNKSQVKDNLHKAVANIITQNMDKDKAITHIKSVLKGKIPNDKLEDIAEQVLILADRVRPAEPKIIDQETKRIIKGNISDILDLSNVQIKNRGKVEEILHKSVADIIAKGMDNEKAIAHIKTVLKGKVPADKIDDIAEQVLTMADQVKPTKAKTIDPATKQMIKEDISDILSESGFYHRNRGKVEDDLHKAVADIVRRDMSESKAVAHIKSILKGKVPDDKIEAIAGQVLSLADQARSDESKAIDQETKQIIKEDISNILDLSDSQIKNRGKVEDSLQKAVADIVARDMDESKAMAHIKTALKGKVSNDKIDEIAKQVLTLANEVNLTESTKIDRETKGIIKENIKDILDLSNVQIKNRGKVEQDLQKTIANIVSKGMSKDKAISHIKSVLRGKVPEETADDIAQEIHKLVDKVNPTEDKNISKIVLAMAEGNQSMFDSSLEQSISEILDHTNGRITNRSKVEESLRDILNDLVMRGMDTREAQNQIHNILRGNVPDSQVPNISKKILALADQLSASLNDYGSGPSASSTQNAETMYFKQVYEVIRDWLNSNSTVKLKERDFKEVVEAIANDVVDRQKYLQLNPGVKTSEEKECEILREQVYKALYKLIDNKSVLSVMSDVENLNRSLKTIPKLLGKGALVQDSKEFVQENLEGALLDWLKGAPIYQYRNPRNRQVQEQIISNLAASLTTLLSSQMKDKPSIKMDEELLKEITKQLEELPLEPQFKSKEYIRMLANHMLDYLKSLQLFQDISLRAGINDIQRITSFMPSTNHLHDVVRDWCKDLPLPDTDRGFEIKQDLANKIILKIGELNMNQDIFNDDLLYEEMLQDFIDQHIEALHIDLDEPESSKKLIDEIMKVKQKVKDNLIGRAYKQRLRDTVANTLPSIVCPTEEDLASFELLKENLADAFINLHYSGEDAAVKAKLKRRITDEVNKFVNEYLSCCPASPISASELNENLYKALKNVPVPLDDASMRSEVEAVRLKDVIYNWLKTLPLGRQTKAEQLHTNKIITLMCQKLQELESEFNPDFEDIAKEEIKKYLSKLPLKNKSNLDRMAKMLVDRIINTSESRSFIERPISALDDDVCLSKIKCLPHQQHQTGIASRASYLSCNSPIRSFDPCKKDKIIIPKFKGRAQCCETSTQSTKCCCTDAALDPPPLDNTSQTEMRPVNKCCQCVHKSDPVCSKPICPKTIRIINAPPTECKGSQADLCPYVRKGYHADCIYGDRIDIANQTLDSGSIAHRLPPPLIPSRGICSPYDYITPEYCGMRRRIQPPRSCRANFRPREQAPRRQLHSACPNDYIRRPKPHNCVRPRHVLPNSRSRRKYVDPSCCRMKVPCPTCREAPLYPKCYRPNIPCPHPTCLYFK